MAEVRIAPALPGVADEIESARLLIDATQLADVPVTAGDLHLQLTSAQIVQIELSPIIALGEPDHLVGSGQSSPVHHPIARFELRGDVFLQNIAHGTGRRICYAQDFVLVVPRRRDKRQV